MLLILGPSKQLLDGLCVREQHVELEVQSLLPHLRIEI